MKTLNQILFTVAVAGTITLANNASAQYRAVGDDGIAASPKVRQMLNERKAAQMAHATVAKTAPATLASVGYRPVGDDGIAASPKLRQLLNERRAAANTPARSSEVASVGYRPTGADGITASPKLRQQLDERAAARFMIAPLK